jgi:hypothetical protein
LARIAVALETLNTILARLPTTDLLPSPPSDPERGLIVAWSSIAANIKRVADRLDPPPPDVVDSVYVAGRLGCTTTWVAEMARRGQIPPSCVVRGTGAGKPWKFYRARVEEWVTSR